MRERERELERERAGKWEKGKVHSYQPRGYYKALEAESTTFFFTNIPDSYGAKEMWEIFMKWGSVGDVVIPNKRDRRGGRFGFVRFRNVGNNRVLEKDIQNIWVEGYKIRINTPKYERTSGEKRPPTTTTYNHDTRARPEAPWSRDHSDRTQVQDPWRRAVLGQGKRSPPSKEKVWGGLEYVVKAGTMARLEECYAGEVRNLEDATSIRELLLREGLFTINAKPMGGNMVLLEGQSPSEIEELLKTEKEWFESIFLEMRKWSPSEVVRERYVWIRCFGIPVQAWEEDFFSMLASKWGRMVELERKTKNRERLDIGSFLIATTSNRCIDESIPVKVGDLIVDIRVVEDPLEMMGWDAGPEDSEELSSQESEEGVSETFFDEVWPETPQRKGLADGQDGEEEDVSSQGRSIPRNLSDKSVGLVQQILALSTPSRSNSRKGKAKNKEEKAEDAVLGGIRNGEITKNRKEVSGGGGSRLEATAVTASEEGIDRVKVTVRSNQNLQIREEDHSFLNSKYVGPVTSLGQAQKEKGHNGQKTVQLKKKKVGFISPKSSKLLQRGKKVQERNRFSSLSEEDSSEKSEDCYLRSLVIKNRARFADSKTEKGMTSGTKGRGESAIEGTGILEKKSLTSKVGKRKMEVAKMFCCKLPRILQNHKKKRKSLQNSFDRRTQKKSVKSKAEGLSRSTRSTRSDLQSVEPDPSIDNSISDSNVHCVNRLLLRYGDKVAGKLWEVGKSIGVTFDGEDCEMIRKIGELERKDRLGSEDHNHKDQEGVQ
ncbi:hypothetical protein RIF29_18300 [Crotalaria pallida]|uniref:RRM domain-containing protein n=1 Tax=Crotalaria pallida TaxID=3830 RepID=A0AAN9IG33_CROPI